MTDSLSFALNKIIQSNCNAQFPLQLSHYQTFKLKIGTP